jgi:hypothetical protein
MHIKYLPIISTLKKLFPIIVIVVEFATGFYALKKPCWSQKIKHHYTWNINNKKTWTTSVEPVQASTIPTMYLVKVHNFKNLLQSRSFRLPSMYVNSPKNPRI